MNFKRIPPKPRLRGTGLYKRQISLDIRRKCSSEHKYNATFELQLIIVRRYGGGMEINMKKSIKLLFFAVALILTFLLFYFLLRCMGIVFSSCAPEVPITSENFDRAFYESFEEKYSVKDPNLVYMTAGPFEAQMKGNILISVIDGVDKNMFVAGTKVSHLYGKSYDYPYVYQTEDAPTPMKDWTIKNIYITKCTDLNYRLPSDDNPSEVIENLMQRYLGTNEVLKLYTKYDDSGARFIESMEEAYSKRRSSSIPRSNSRYKLLFTFEECPNIVWISDLWWANGYFFIEVNTIDSTDSPDHRTFGLINEESGEMIREALISGGWVEPEHIPGLLPPTFPQMFQ